MAKLRSARDQASYVDTPKGMFTASGVWFLTTEEALRRYAGEVVERVPVEGLVRRAEVWLRSPETLALWATPALLSVLSPLPAVLAALTVYVGWAVVGPSFTSLAAERAIRVLDQVWLQALYYVVALSLLSGEAGFAPVWAGLALFIVMRWGLAARLAGPLVGPLQRRLYTLPVPDQVLRGFVIRVAMKHRLSLPQLDQIERDIASGMRRRG